MTVCIAEKPSVAKEIAYILGANKRHDGYFEGNGYCVTYTFGHFCTLYTPDDYHPHWKKWDFNTLPMLPPKFEIKLIANKGVKKQFGIIKKLLKSAQNVINCGDAGQEGELIQRWVLKHAKYKGSVQRLWISSLTKEAIKNGFQNLKPASDYDNLYFAGSSRAIGDWLLGMNATRLYTLKYGGYKQVLSIGRVQTPTLAMIVKRYHEINNFKSEKYWELETLYREVAFQYEEGKFKKPEDGLALIEQIKDKNFVIESVVKKNGKEYSPKLFDLTGLQVFCNKAFGFTAENTLKLVQKLYEQKLVTYPRVDTTFLPTDVHPKVKGILQNLTNYSTFIQPLLQKPIPKTTRVFNDKKITDHHAIIPTGVQKSGLPFFEANILDAITRRFIGVFYPPSDVANTKVVGAVEKIKFKATGKEILTESWRILFPKKKKKQEDGENKKNEIKILPAFTVGESGPHIPSLLEKQTKPPKNYTEATLLRAMETAGKRVDDENLRDLMKENGIGRPSTRANIIETLFRRKYIFRQRKNIIASSVGIELIGVIQNDLLKSPELTGRWEKQLRDIEQGHHKALPFINAMKKMVEDLVTEVRVAKNVTRIQAPVKNNFKISRSKKATSTSKVITNLSCPKCKKGKIIKGKTAYGCSNWNTGCSLKVPFEYSGKKISDNQIFRLISKGSTVNLKGFKNGPSKVNGMLKFDTQFNVFLMKKGAVSTQKKNLFEQKKDSMPCPKCKKGRIIKGKTAYGCSNWKTGCEFLYSFELIKKNAKGKKLTKELVITMLNGAKI